MFRGEARSEDVFVGVGCGLQTRKRCIVGFMLPNGMTVLFGSCHCSMHDQSPSIFPFYSRDCTIQDANGIIPASARGESIRVVSERRLTHGASCPTKYTLLGLVRITPYLP